MGINLASDAVTFPSAVTFEASVQKGISAGIGWICTKSGFTQGFSRWQVGSGITKPVFVGHSAC